MSEYVGEIIGLSVAVGVGAITFIYIAVWNYQEEKRAKLIPQPLEPVSNQSTKKEITREDIIQIRAAKELKTQQFARTLTYAQIPLNQKLTIHTSWGLEEKNVLIRKKQLQTLSGALNVILTVESADNKLKPLRNIAPLLVDPSTQIIKNTTFSIEYS
jgi:hypothetical protein